MKKLMVFIMLAMASAPAQAQNVAAAQESPQTELIYRVNLGRADDVKLLLDNGASANQKDEKGTPLICLASVRVDEEGIKVVKILVAAGADVNAKDAENKNALFYAAKKNNKEIAQFLLENRINYYSTDYTGNIARTIAYREGNDEMVKLMDDFVKGETAKVTEQYNALSKALEDQYKAQEAGEKQAADAATQEALEKSRLATEAEIKAREDADAEELEKMRASEAFTQAKYDLAFHTCSFQYWAFCKAAEQTVTELTPDALDSAILSHQQQIAVLRENLEKTYKTGKKFTDQIITAAQRSVFNQLNNMPSKTWRFQNGVCKMADLVKRCDIIAKTPAQVTTKAEKKPAQPGRNYRRISR